MSETVRFGVLGIGSIAQAHAKAARALGHDVVVACAKRRESPNWDAFTAMAPGAERCDDWRAVAARPDIGGVIVCLPWDQIDPNLDALLKNCSNPLLIEKPPALSRTRLEAVLRAAPEGRDGARVMVGFNRRFYPNVQALRARIAEGGLRAVRIVISEDVARQIARKGAAIRAHILTFSAAAHSLDLALYLLPGFRLCSRIGDLSTEGVVHLQGTGAAGVPVAITIGYDTVDASGQSYYFSDGSTWRLQPLEVLERFDGYEIVEASEALPVRQYFPKRSVVTSCFDRPPESAGSPAEIKPGMLEQLDAFARRCGSGKQIEEDDPAADLSDFARLLQLTEEIMAPHDINKAEPTRIGI